MEIAKKLKILRNQVMILFETINIIRGTNFSLKSRKNINNNSEREGRLLIRS